MAERETHERIVWWPWALSLGVVASLLVGMLVLLPMFGRSEYRVGIYDAPAKVAMVHFHTQPWAATGAKRSVPDANMVAVGQTDEGFFIYADRTQETVGGGGGGGPETGAPPSTYKQVYLRTQEGIYQPIARK